MSLVKKPMVSKVDWLRIFRQAYQGKIVLVCLAVILNLGDIACKLITPLIGRLIFDEALPANSYSLTFGLGAIWLLLLCVGTVFEYIYSVLVAKADIEAVNNLRTATIRAILVKFWGGSGTNEKQGKLLSRILTDPQRLISSSGIDSIIATIKAAVMFVVAAVLIVYFDWPMALVCVVGAIISLASQYRTPQSLERSNRKIASSRADITHVIECILAAWRTIIRHQRIGQEVAYAERALRGLSDTQKRARNKMYTAQLQNALIMNLLPIILIWVGAFRIMSGNMSLGTFIAFFSYLYLINDSLRTLFMRGLNIFSGVGQAKDFAQLVSSSKDEKRLPRRYSCPDVIETLRIKHVTLNAGPFDFSADGISFSEGMTYLLTGSSGVGKSTFLEFLAGIRKADCADILINDRRFEADSFLQVAKTFGYIGKDEVLLDRSVSENIYGLSSDKSGHIEEYAQVLGMDYYFLRKSITGLSAGEKQRISLVRELARKPGLFIIDEGIDSLDGDLKTSVLDLIRRELPKCILVICTHNWQNDTHVNGRLLVSNGQIYQES